MWLVNSLDDIRSDMSRFHRVDEVEHMTADRFVSYASRLNAYGGVVAQIAQQQQPASPTAQTKASPVVQQAAELKDVRELMATDPMYRGLFTAVSVPAPE